MAADRLFRLDRTLLAALLSGLLLAAAFPRPDLYPLAWVALVPLLLVMQKRPFASGLATGFSFFAVLLYWLNVVMVRYGGLSALFSLLAYLLLVFYLALWFGLASWLSCLLKKRLGLPFLFSFPVLWISLEYLRGLALSGFPWGLIGYSQQNFPAAIQTAEVTGVYGAGFLVVVVNCALAAVIASPKARLTWLGAVMALLMCVSHFAYGAWRGAQPLEERARQLTVGLIQGSIEQGQKWLPEFRQQSLDRYQQLSHAAVAKGAELLLWPEAATPFYLQEDSPASRQVRQLPEALDAALLVGSPGYSAQADGTVSYLNSAYLFHADGTEAGRSDKIHLVPFGEYVPFARWLPFVKKLVAGVGDFSPGSVRPLPLGGDQLGVLICYEAIFPGLARDYVRNGSDLLVNVTNDAWFGKTSAPHQLLAMTRFRAIENRIWIARAANTGISALISPAGRVVAATPLFQPVQLTGTVGLGATPTFYTRFGDVFAWICLLIAGAELLLLAIKRRPFPFFSAD